MFRKTGQQAVGPFKIIERIGTFIYYLDLPVNMRIYSIISIIYFKLATNFARDPYRRRPLFIPIIIDGINE